MYRAAVGVVTAVVSGISLCGYYHWNNEQLVQEQLKLLLSKSDEAAVPQSRDNVATQVENEEGGHFK